MNVYASNQDNIESDLQTWAADNAQWRLEPPEAFLPRAIHAFLL